MNNQLPVRERGASRYKQTLHGSVADQCSTYSRLMETPDFAHLIRSKAFENVYEPAEDTFLMLDALESELNIIKEPG